MPPARQILMLSSDRAALRDPDTFYAQDLVGLAVRRVGAAAGEPPLGRVVDLFSGTGTHDTLRVELAIIPADVVAGTVRTVLVPFAKALVPNVDVAGGFMEIDPPEGLLDLVSTAPMRRSVRLALQAAARPPGAPAEPELPRAGRRGAGAAAAAAAAAPEAPAAPPPLPLGAGPKPTAQELSSRPSPGTRGAGGSWRAGVGRGLREEAGRGSEGGRGGEGGRGRGRGRGGGRGGR